MSISIIGDNHIGRSLHKIFKSAIIYDSNIDEYPNTVKGAFCFVCLQVPQMNNGEPNISIIENIIKRLEVGIIVIYATVLPGTTDYLKKKYGKRIVFLSVTDNFENSRWLSCICGGYQEDTQLVIDLFAQHMDEQKIYRQTAAKTAELCKYMENLWLAMQVTFVNEFYNICEKIGVDYHELCDLWAMNPKISRNRTSVQVNARGFAEKELTSDLTAMISFVEQIELKSYLFDGISRSNSFNLRRNPENYVKNLDTGKDIIRFYQIDHPYGFFSNFSHHPVYLKNKIWMTSEHYYQAQKFAGTEDEETVRLTHSPVKTARTAHAKENLVRPDWEVVKNDVMREVLHAKFTQHPELTAELLATSPLSLVEHTANDNYWGDGGDGSGKNMLGRILMEIRSRLQQSL